MIGATIDQYKIVKAISRSPVGETFLATHVSTGAKYILKAVTPKLMPLRGFRERFLKDAVEIIKFEHPNVAPLANVLEENDRLYTVREFIPGHTLARLLKKASPGHSLENCMPIFKDVLKAVGYAHLEGYVHRRLNPENIFVTPSGEAKVTAFDQVLQQEKEKRIKKDALVREARYFSPERFGHADITDIRVNIYGLGVILYQMATGSLPFDADTFDELLAKHREQLPPDPRELNGSLPDEVVRATLKALSKQPEQRFQNTLEFYKSLQPEETKADSRPSQMAFNVQVPEPGDADLDRSFELLSEQEAFDETPAEPEGKDDAKARDPYKTVADPSLEDLAQLKAMRESQQQKREAAENVANVDDSPQPPSTDEPADAPAFDDFSFGEDAQGFESEDAAGTAEESGGFSFAEEGEEQADGFEFGGFNIEDHDTGSTGFNLETDSAGEASPAAGEDESFKVEDGVTDDVAFDFSAEADDAAGASGGFDFGEAADEEPEPGGFDFGVDSAVTDMDFDRDTQADPAATAEESDFAESPEAEAASFDFGEEAADAESPEAGAASFDFGEEATDADSGFDFEESSSPAEQSVGDLFDLSGDPSVGHAEAGETGSASFDFGDPSFGSDDADQGGFDFAEAESEGAKEEAFDLGSSSDGFDGTGFDFDISDGSPTDGATAANETPTEGDPSLQDTPSDEPGFDFAADSVAEESFALDDEAADFPSDDAQETSFQGVDSSEDEESPFTHGGEEILTDSNSALESDLSDPDAVLETSPESEDLSDDEDLVLPPKEGLEASIAKIEQDKPNTPQPVVVKRVKKIDFKVIALTAVLFGVLAVALFTWYQSRQRRLQQDEIVQSVTQLKGVGKYEEALDRIDRHLPGTAKTGFGKKLAQLKESIHKEQEDIEKQVATLMDRASRLESEGQAFSDGKNDALGTYMTILSLDPDHGEAGQAVATIKAGQLEKVDTLLESEQDLDALQILAGLVKADRGDKQVLNRYQALKGTLKKEQAGALQQQINDLFTNRRYEAIVPLLKELDQIDPESKFVASMQKSLVDTFITAGQDQRARNQFGKAEAAYRHVLELDPDNKRVSQALAELEEERLRASVANTLRALERAVESQNLRQQHLLANELIQLDPGNPIANSALENVAKELALLRKEAETKRELGQYKEAAKLYKTIYDIDGNEQARSDWKKFDRWSPPPKMAFVPVGPFKMGSNSSADSRPAHRVFITNFFIDQYEVTNREYLEFLAARPEWHPSRIENKYHDGNYLQHWENGLPADDDLDRPVTNVSWFAAKAYAAFKNKRLPTEAEWEKAAAGNTRELKYWWGNYSDAKMAVYEFYPEKRPAPVGSFPANGFGIYEILGNVHEWVEDTYSPTFYAQTEDARDPVNRDPGPKVFRGGSYKSRGKDITLYMRYFRDPRFCNPTVGFRCAMDAALDP